MHPTGQSGNWKVIAPMTSLPAILRSILAPLCLAFALLFAASPPATAQLSFKPTEQAVQEDKLLDALKAGDKVTGRITIPDQTAANLIQPAGVGWRDFQRNTLPIIGGIAIIGMAVLLAVFLMVRGRIRVEKGFSGATLVRFPSLERFTHWLTASCFIILGLSGLNISFGKSLLLPLFGPEAFSALSHCGQARSQLSGVPVHARNLRSCSWSG